MLFNLFDLFKRRASDAYSDTSEFIYVDNSPVPLNDTEYDIFHKDIEIIQNLIKLWIISDLQSAPTLNISKDQTISYTFYNLNIKNIVDPSCMEIVERIANSSGNEYARRSYGRWQDTVLQISLLVRTTTLDVLRARFVDHMLYGIDANDLASTKQDWCEVIRYYPWVPLLSLLQHIFATDTDINDLIHR